MLSTRANTKDAIDFIATYHALASGPIDGMPGWNFLVCKEASPGNDPKTYSVIELYPKDVAVINEFCSRADLHIAPDTSDPQLRYQYKVAVKFTELWRQYKRNLKEKRDN